MTHEYDDCLARAYEVLEQANRTLDQQQRAPVEAAYTAEPIPDYSRCTTTQEMTIAQFNRWCIDGKPALSVTKNVTEIPGVTKAKVADMVRAAVEQERANTQAAWETLASIIGEETGKADAKLAEQIRQLRIELVELKAELHDVRGERSADAVELPVWPYATATH